MTLISSISGIRGTIGGEVGNNLTPFDIVNYTSAYADVLLAKTKQPVVLVGRDGRVTGLYVQNIIVSTLILKGINVLDCGLTTTPTIEMGIVKYKAEGGIMVSASHNPMNWNALKLFNAKGEFIDKSSGQKIQKKVKNGEFEYVDYESIGKLTVITDILKYHVDEILKLPYINIEAIKRADFNVALDAINSSGGEAVPYLLERLGVKNIYTINSKLSEQFAHNPEPLEQNLIELKNTIVNNNCDVGFAVDPDVDRLAMMCENGEYFGEEYTLVACADYVLQHKIGNTVSNLSSSRALKDITLKYGAKHYAAEVGEVNVSTRMKITDAVIGGEGNGGVILPELHYGRDALLGIALVLSYMAESKKTMTEIRAKYPNYFMAKEKFILRKKIAFQDIKTKIKKHVKKGEIDERDGIKIDFQDAWIHVRASNTEPIIRIYTEAKTQKEADELAQEYIKLLKV